ncbi:MAG TPA: PGPGW domain-containing protein [Polyangiales bacterium]|nr:PGPGW domain-containing protein [Polyangiales bacterium]
MIDQIFQFAHAHRTALYWVSGVSVAMFVGSLLLVPWVIKRAPQDYFTREPDKHEGRFGWLRWCALNLFGLALLLIGIALLALPGQGILLILLALTVMDFPGKHALVVRIAKKPAVWRGLDYFRQRAHEPPFDPP